MNSVDTEESHDWPPYLRDWGSSPLEADLEDVKTQISDIARRLFVDEKSSSFESLEISSQTTGGARSCKLVAISKAEELKGFLNRSQNERIAFINQSYSWSKLLVCQEHFERLFLGLGVNVKFINILRLFSEKIAPVEESLSYSFVDIPSQGKNGGEVIDFDIGYNLKYVARHNRTYPKDPFAIREVGIYQAHRSQQEQCHWIFLQAPTSLKSRVQSIFRRETPLGPLEHLMIHAMLMLDLSNGWRDYLMYLEEEFSEIVEIGFYTDIKGSQLEGDLTADFSEIRSLQVATDKYRRLVQLLLLNVRLGRSMKQAVKDIQLASPSCNGQAITRLQVQFDDFVNQQETSVDRLNALIGRSSGISSLIQNILEIRASEATKLINQEMRQLTKQSVEEGHLIKRLTQQSVSDTKSMRTIALISAIFLPATFLATLFGSNFFGYSANDHLLKVASNFWIYILFVVATSAVSLIFYFRWRQSKSREDECKDIEMGEAPTIRPGVTAQSDSTDSTL